MIDSAANRSEKYPEQARRCDAANHQTRDQAGLHFTPRLSRIHDRRDCEELECDQQADQGHRFSSVQLVDLCKSAVR